MRNRRLYVQGDSKLIISKLMKSSHSCSSNLSKSILEVDQIFFKHQLNHASRLHDKHADALASVLT